METLFIKMVNMSITASYLVLMIFVLRFLLKRTPKSILCALWAMVAIRLVCPYSLHSKYSLVTSKPVLSTSQIQLTPSDAMNIPIIHSSNSLKWITMIWLLGILIMFGLSLYTTLQLKRKLKVTLSIDQDVYISDEINTPFVLGLLQPKIYLPSFLNERQRVQVIRHEKAHIQRCDYLWKPLGYILLSLYWFNPLLWIAYSTLCKDIEFATDEKVISQMDKRMIAEYSKTLLACSVNTNMLLACPVSFAEVGVKERVKTMIDYKKPSFWIITFSVIVCVVFGICFMTNQKEPTTDNIPDTIVETLSSKEWEKGTFTLNDLEYQLGESTVSSFNEFPLLKMEGNRGYAKEKSSDIVTLSSMEIPNLIELAYVNPSDEQKMINSCVVTKIHVTKNDYLEMNILNTSIDMNSSKEDIINAFGNDYLEVDNGIQYSNDTISITFIFNEVLTDIIYELK